MPDSPVTDLRGCCWAACTLSSLSPLPAAVVNLAPPSSANPMTKASYHFATSQRFCPR